MIVIKLTKGYETIVSDEDADLAELRWCVHIGTAGRVCAVRSVNKRREWLHRVVFSRTDSALMSSDFIDHIDNNPLNNCRDNLRKATSAQNKQNSQRKKDNILKGAHYHKRDKKWGSSITVDGVLRHLGTFDTPEEAHEAYKQAAINHFGEFARWD